MDVELTADDFTEWDWDEVIIPVQQVFSEMHDIVFHEVADGTWAAPEWLSPRTVPNLIDQARTVLDRLDGAVREARNAIAEAERDARLRAINRVRRSGGGQR